MYRLGFPHQPSLLSPRAAGGKAVAYGRYRSCASHLLGHSFVVSPAMGCILPRAPLRAKRLERGCLLEKLGCWPIQPLASHVAPDKKSVSFPDISFLISRKG